MAEVQVGRAVDFAQIDVADHFAGGTVITVDDRQPVTGGHVIVTLDGGGAGRPDEYAYADGRVAPDGRFAIEFKPAWKALWCDYLPDTGFATATSKTFTR
jgi:hypothetical protein